VYSVPQSIPKTRMGEVYCGFVASAVGVQRSGVQQSGSPSAEVA